jgi:hypothetical protein
VGCGNDEAVYLMATDQEQLTIVKKEMGITHKDFYGELPNLFKDIPYRQSEETIRFQINGKKVEIVLAPETVRELGRSVRLPVTFVTLRFFACSKEEIDGFIRHFNLKFMKGGG